LDELRNLTKKCGSVPQQLEDCPGCNNFEAKDIYSDNSVDETGCTTVQKPAKVIAATEVKVKQIVAITSSAS
jgi:hypothetical protein